MRTHTWSKIRVGLVTVFLATIPMLVSAESGPGERRPLRTCRPSRCRCRNGPPRRCSSAITLPTPLQALDVASTLARFRARR